jgi:hypothetical protein
LPEPGRNLLFPKDHKWLDMSGEIMSGPLNETIEALREELLQYGEMLARFDDQQELLGRNAADAAPAGETSLHDQKMIIQKTRRRREQAQRKLARQLGLPEAASLLNMVPLLPPSHQPLVRALRDENIDLALLVERRGWQEDLRRRSLHLVPGPGLAGLPIGLLGFSHRQSKSLLRGLSNRVLRHTAG